MSHPSKIVADGRHRGYEAIRAEVATEFEEQFRGASFWQRCRLWFAARAEVKRRFKAQFPHALYVVR